MFLQFVIDIPSAGTALISIQEVLMFQRYLSYITSPCTARYLQPHKFSFRFMHFIAAVYQTAFPFKLSQWFTTSCLEKNNICRYAFKDFVHIKLSMWADRLRKCKIVIELRAPASLFNAMLNK